MKYFPNEYPIKLKAAIIEGRKCSRITKIGNIIQGIQIFALYA